jgi:glycosyltransferase involved in cell wall biosynthesis
MSIDMLVFGEDWGKHPSSTQHLIKHLLADQQILWVNSLGLRRPQLNKRDLKRIWQKLSSFINQPQSAAHLGSVGPRLVNPLTLPLPGNPLARWCNSKLLSSKLKPLFETNDKPLLWTSLPSAVDIVGKLGERAAIYYCGDDFSALDGVDHSPIERMEMELATKCQLIITASNALAQKFPAHKTMVLPHGVDYELFSTPAPKAADLPEGPVAGFYGALAGWFDQQLMIDTARLLPGWTFVLVGPANTDITNLLAEPNIKYLGSRAHHELPRYSQHWDVGLLPFKRNQQIAACNPLKLREYLAAGSPIVSTEFPALDGYRDLVRSGNSARFFAESIQEFYAYKYHRQLMSEIRQQRVCRESWSKRAEDLKEVLGTL